MRSGRAGTFSYSLDKAASVTITIEQVQAGRKIGRVCKKQTRKNRKKRACTLFVADRQALSVRCRGPQHAALLRQARRQEAEAGRLPRHGRRSRRRRQVRSRHDEVRGDADERPRREERGLQKRQAREAAARGRRRGAVGCTPPTRSSAPAPQTGWGDMAASWAFYGLALFAVGASVARSGLVHDERPAWIATSVAFGAWFIGSVYYASGGSVDDTLYSFSHRRRAAGAVRRARPPSRSRCWCARA